MFLKLGIIGVILVLGALVFSSEINELFHNTSSSVVESLKEDVGEIGARATESVEKRLDTSIDKVVEKTSKQINTEINDVKESSKSVFSNKLEKFSPLEALGNFFSNKSQEYDYTEMPKISPNDHSTKENSLQDQKINTNAQEVSYESLSLSTVQQSDENILLRYSDLSGKTESASIIISTYEKEIFSGTFYAPMFETIVTNASGTPYFVDMVVKHQSYGTVTSSVFNPGDHYDSVINGIFFQS